MDTRWLFGLLAGLHCAAGLAAAAPGEDWPTYGHDPGGQRHSPLADITPANVSRLQVAWRYSLRGPTATAPPAPAEDAASAAQRSAEAAGSAPRRRNSTGRIAGHAADGGRPAVPHHALRTRSGARGGHRSRDLEHAGSRSGPAVAARRGVLARRRRGGAADLLRHARWPTARARCEGWPARARVRRRRGGQPRHIRGASGRRFTLLWHDLAAGGVPQPGDHRRGRTGVSAPRRRG